ncbi:UNVERIFIED_ORG: thiopeptide-type bacteriocin biosynthesis protein [Microbispora rosea subsp. rosea]
MPASAFRASPVGLLRAVANATLDVPPWPDLTGPAEEHVQEWARWLSQVWAVPAVAEALEHAAPALAEQVHAVLVSGNPAPATTRRCVLAVARYLLRMTGRATPLGLLAGVAPAAVAAANVGMWWGSDHRAVAAAGADWLAAVIARLENSRALLLRLPVVANTTAVVRGDRLIVPYQLLGGPTDEAMDLSVRHTTAVAAAVDAARAPIQLEDLAAKLCVDFPNTEPSTVTDMLIELVTRRVLVTSLHAPSTEPDALGYLMRQLHVASAHRIDDVADLVAGLAVVHELLQTHNQLPAGKARQVRDDVAARMRAIASTSRHPVAVDLRLDAAVTVPPDVAAEVERAALVLTRLSAYPYGTPQWRAYHQRFYERYGIGSMVPVTDVVADSGIGWPDGYPGTVTEEPRSPMSHRDEVLLTLAQRAALDGANEVILNEDLIASLELGPQEPRVPPHLEVGIRVYATGVDALRTGRFRVEITSVSRGAGTLIGRFLPVLDQQSRADLVAALAGMPSGDADTVSAQLSFPPLDPATGHVTRTVQVHPTVVSLAEHHTPGWHVLTPDDLAVACDGRRMVLAAPAHGVRVHATSMHALSARTHTPPLARLLTELPRAQYAQVTTFRWGAAERLPYLPRVRYGRVILAPARWRINAGDLPGPTDKWAAWNTAWQQLASRRRVPHLVHLVQGDQRLPLDLNQDGHRVLLRTHLNRHRYAVLAEAPAPDDIAWCGGRAHEVIIPLAAATPAPWPRLPKPTRARVLHPGHGDTPAASPVLLAALYGELPRQDAILAEHLPGLLARLGNPMWWFVRYRDPDQHLRLRIALPTADAFCDTARTVSAWADELRRIGLLRHLTYATSYAEPGRWGDGPALAAAEQVFAADSRAVLAQLRQENRPARQALVAAHTVAIAAAFTGSTAAGMRWLAGHIPATAPTRVPRPLFTRAVVLAIPDYDWAVLRSTQGGDAIAQPWADRDRAIAEYRTHLPGPHTEGINPDDVLASLLHVHYVRAHAIDFPAEAECMYLARAAALAWLNSTMGGTR